LSAGWQVEDTTASELTIQWSGQREDESGGQGEKIFDIRTENRANRVTNTELNYVRLFTY
jgi:hypothetical protein